MEENLTKSPSLPEELLITEEYCGKENQFPSGMQPLRGCPCNIQAAPSGFSGLKQQKQAHELGKKKSWERGREAV